MKDTPYRRIWVAALVTFVLTSSSAAAQTVGKVLRGRRIVLVKNAPEGAAKGMKVCFYRKNGRKTACGTVKKLIKGNRMVIHKVPRRRIRTVRRGMTVKLENAGSGGGSAPATAGSSTSNPLKLRLAYNPAFLMPATYQQLSYNPPESDSPDTLWTQNSATGLALIGISMEGSIPLGSVALVPGFRYRLYRDSAIDADYIKGQRNPFTRSETTASSYGVWFDGAYQISLAPSIGWEIRSGLDLDFSSLTFKAKKKDDSGETEEITIAEANSSLGVASLRFATGIDYLFSSNFGMHFHLISMVPLASFAGSFEGSLDDPDAPEGLEDPKGDLKGSLGHKKNSFAVGIALGTVVAF